MIGENFLQPFFLLMQVTVMKVTHTQAYSTILADDIHVCNPPTEKKNTGLKGKYGPIGALHEDDFFFPYVI